MERAWVGWPACGMLASCGHPRPRRRQVASCRVLHVVAIIGGVSLGSIICPTTALSSSVVVFRRCCRLGERCVRSHADSFAPAAQHGAAGVHDGCESAIESLSLLSAGMLTASPSFGLCCCVASRRCRWSASATMRGCSWCGMSGRVTLAGSVGCAVCPQTDRHATLCVCLSSGSLTTSRRCSHDCRRRLYVHRRCSMMSACSPTLSACLSPLLLLLRASLTLARSLAPCM